MSDLYEKSFANTRAGDQARRRRRVTRAERQALLDARIAEVIERELPLAGSGADLLEALRRVGFDVVESQQQHE